MPVKYLTEMELNEYAKKRLTEVEEEFKTVMKLNESENVDKPTQLLKDQIKDYKRLLGKC
jgi:hypothetical protein